MKKIVYVLAFILISFLSKGQFSELKIDLFQPKKVKTIYTYFKSTDTLKFPENKHEVLEKKTEYYRNGIIKSSLDLYGLFFPPKDTSYVYTVYNLNNDSTIKSERFFITSEQKWIKGRKYKYKNKSKYPYEIIGSKYNKTLHKYDSVGKIIREKTFYGRRTFTMYDYVYDSLGRLIQCTCYPQDYYTENGWGKRYERQYFFVFKYHYEKHSDSLFCIEEGYDFTTSVKNWDKLRSESPKKFNLKDTSFKVEMQLNYKIKIFNNHQEIIGDYHCSRNENPSYPYSRHWTKRTYVYEYY
jgi:hypothetical protein